MLIIKNLKKKNPELYYNEKIKRINKKVVRKYNLLNRVKNIDTK